jgi:arylsulfatase A-like enzyme
MKPVLVLLATLCLGLPSTAAEQRPNIVFVLADDLGIVDINAYATRFTGAGPSQMYDETPNLDRLVACSG